MNDQLALPAPKPEDLLTAKERAVYERYVAAGGVGLAPSKADEFFNLYLAGKTCSEIQRVNKEYTYGSILRARIEFKWDEIVEAHRESLSQRAQENLQLTVLQQVDFLSDMLGACWEMNHEKLKKFRQTKNPVYLEGVPLPENWKDYERLAKVLLMLTGQTVKKTEQKVTHEHHVVPAGAQPTPQPLNPQDAAAMLAELDE